jgi:hypothetical protein
MSPEVLERAVEANAQDLDILERMAAPVFAKSKKVVPLPTTGAAKQLTKSRAGSGRTPLLRPRPARA